jgi:hypothetical protein
VLIGGEGRTPKCPRADKAVTESNFRKREGPECPLTDKAVAGSNVQKREGHRNVQRQIRLSLRATLERERGTEMSIGR